MDQSKKQLSKNSHFSYLELQSELDLILLELQSKDIDPDAAIKLYNQGLTIVQQLEKRIEEADNKIIKLKAKFG